MHVKKSLKTSLAIESEECFQRSSLNLERNHEDYGGTLPKNMSNFNSDRILLRHSVVVSLLKNYFQ
jgi:hypothetical protein